VLKVEAQGSYRQQMKSRRYRRGVGAALFAFATFQSAGFAYGSPVVDKSERMEVNWSTMRIRFFGQAKIDGDEDYKTVEKQAWAEGLSYVSDAVRDLNFSVQDAAAGDTEKLTEDARKAATQVSTSTSSYNTTYYGDGTVRVFLENSLSKAFVTTGLRFRQKEALTPSMIQYTGVVIKTSKAIKPRPTYQVIDEKGNVLFDVSDMAEEAYRKNLMGRWFKNPGASEVTKAVGSNPIYLEASAQDDGRLVVQRAQWDEKTAGHRALLVNGNIALALP
jgi:hypothetical protein